jgi:hypothetical protein
MGLDVVELLMNVEEHYGFEIPDAQARLMRSVGDLHAYILAHAPRRPSDEEAWKWLRTMIAEEFGVSPERVTREAWVVRDLGIN